jgi:hypothetical protein
MTGMRTLVTRSFTFEAAHQLPWHPGKCRDLHDLIDNPTAELIAHDICKSLEAAGLAVARVRLWETDDCMVEVTPE